MPNEIARSFDGGNNPTVYVSTTKMVVPYRPFAEIENWLRYRMEEKSARKTAFIVAVAAVFLVLGGPFLVLKLIVWLLAVFAAGGSASAAAAAVAQSSAIVAYFYALMTGLIVAGTVIYKMSPTHLSLSDKGVNFIYNHTSKQKYASLNEGNLIPWERITRLNLAKPPNKPAQDHLLCMMSGSLSLMDLRMGAFTSTEDRAHVLEAIEKWAPQIARDPEVIQALEPPSDHSYTEMWMKALSAPPKREKLKPLVSGALLREGKYEVGGALGVGGQGTAYVAYDVGAERRSVVLKEFILPVYVDILVRKQALDRFEREAKILKQLDHPQVVKLIDFFVEDHRGYLVLEHIDGGSLRQLVDKNGPIAEEQARGLALQMCEILTYLHSLTPPVVHRDFTPDNLILRNDGTLKLVDFNVAQQTESTATGTVVGKHAYLPPEQFRGMPNTLSDIYAMGATLFYLVVGEDPEPISVSHPREHQPAVSPDFDLVVAQCTNLDPVLRFHRAADIADALGEATKEAATRA
jgi:tRNA A-37 threonylcarbamoyl transferase component Bud32